MEPMDIPDFLPEILPEGGPAEMGAKPKPKHEGPHGPGCDCKPDQPDPMDLIRKMKLQTGFEIVRRQGRKAELEALDLKAAKRARDDDKLQEAMEAIMAILREQTSRVLKETNDPVETLLVTKGLMDHLIQCMAGDAQVRLEQAMDGFILVGKPLPGCEEVIEGTKPRVIEGLRRGAEELRRGKPATMDPAVLDRLADKIEKS